jgi:2-isopropylmalate synthase
LAQSIDRAGLGHSGEYNSGSTSSLGGRKVHILDSTLREGEQGAGVSFTTRQRLQIAWMLDYFGVDSIEVSPVISRSHFESCSEMVNAGLSAQIVAHARALKQDIDTVLRCGASSAAIYHSVSDIHLRYKLNVDFEDAVRRGVEAVEYAKSHGLKLRFTLEDASRASPDRLIEYAKAMEDAGADRLSIPDTVGVMTPGGMYRLVKLVRESVDIPLDVHCHNDLGLSLANALAGVEAGADQVHTTVGGMGERSGITDLAQLAVTLISIYGAQINVRMNMLKDLYDLVFNYLGFSPFPFMPLLGDNAYKHKAGTHIAAVLRNPIAYEVIPPRFVGARRKLVFGELLGRNGAAFFLKLMGLEPDDAKARSFADAMKGLQMGDLFELEMDERMEKLFLESQRSLEGGE